MEILPIEVKWHICRFVEANPFGILAPLSLTSRDWYDATAPILYETLRVKFGDSVTLQKAVFELREGRRGRLFLKHARRLDIVCLWNYSEKPWHQSNMIYRSMELVHYGLPALDNIFLKYCLKECLDPKLWPYIPDFRHYQEENWQPLVSLIAHLEHLSELNFVVKNMYPPSLHQVLRQYHPECRLNIWTFQGVNLDTPILPRIQRPRAYENLDILCSSGLHPVAMDYFMDEAGRPWVHSDGILQVVCMTPSLKHLNIRGRNSHSVTLLKSVGKKYTATVKPGPAASLVSLSFTSPARCGPWEKTLLEMASFVNLSQLRSLDISIHSDPTLLMRAASILTSQSAEDEDMIAAVQAFNPLKYLWLRGLQRSESLHRLAIEPWDTNHQNSMLSTRYKYPLLDSHDVTELSGSCPNLQKLRLPIKRRGGRPRECDIYNAMGQFPQLHTLVINLGFYHWSNCLNSQNDWAASFRDTLINAATDEDLARGVWDLIVSKQSTQSLRLLRLVPFGATVYSEEKSNAVWEVSRSFLVTRNTCTGQPPDVMEIGTEVWDLLGLPRGEIKGSEYWSSRVKKRFGFSTITPSLYGHKSLFSLDSTYPRPSTTARSPHFLNSVYVADRPRTSSL
ncbi:hypothetical protein BDV24DRAFT_155685 [Aspergillus arachidicola]|uniref:F-box domain-containing protein n=1 Tax=Aspergillus arachidicola TaxID=656916 RepID=A0A5N6XS95_9EURO|nr:hypothetical protein BDV24DRAFT_155685 [Aspergillus arachidicola]